MIEIPPTPQEAAILIALSQYTFATIDQIMRHLEQDPGDSKQLRNTQVKLKALAETEYIKRIERGQTGVKGRLKPAYKLLTKAQRYLRSLGEEIDLYDTPAPGNLNHVLDVNNVILLAMECARIWEEIDLKQIKHDYELKTMQISVVPDAFLHFVVKRPDNYHSFPLLVEVDRGGESLTVIERKILNYIEFGRGEYQQNFNFNSATFVWFITGDIKRLFNIRDVIEAVLTRKNLQVAGQLFYLGRLDDETSPTVFLDNYFYVPFRGEVLFPLLANPPPILSSLLELPNQQIIMQTAISRYHDTIEKLIFEFRNIPPLTCPRCLTVYSVDEFMRIYDNEILQGLCKCGKWFIT